MPPLVRPINTLREKGYDALIIGAGVIGSSIALELSRAGFRTLNVDSELASGSGSTSYSSGIIRSFYSAPDSIALAWEGYQYWADWAGHIGLGGSAGDDSVELARYRECGGFVTRSKLSQSFLNKVVPLSRELGIPFESWDRARAEQELGMDLTAYGPPVRIDDDSFGVASGAEFAIDGGVYFPHTGYVSDPQLATRNLQAAAEATGLASFAFGRTVVDILRRRVGTGSGVRVAGVALDDGVEVAAPVVINASGPHSSKVTAMAFRDDAGDGDDNGVVNDMCVSTAPFRVEVAYLEAPRVEEGVAGRRRDGYNDDCDDSDVSANGSQYRHMVCTDMDAGIYFRPEVGGKLLVGGVEPECDKERNTGFGISGKDPSMMETSLSEEWDNYAYRLALRFPNLRIPNHSAQGIAAMYDVTEDWMPIYDRSAMDGYYMAIGTSGNQFKNAGPVGAMMAAIVQYCESGGDQDNEPLQFELSRTGNKVNTAVWSRLRVVQDTTGTVLS